MQTFRDYLEELGMATSNVKFMKKLVESAPLIEGMLTITVKGIIPGRGFFRKTPARVRLQMDIRDSVTNELLVSDIANVTCVEGSIIYMSDIQNAFSVTIRDDND
jgi:hypothetical protein